VQGGAQSGALSGKTDLLGPSATCPAGLPGAAGWCTVKAGARLVAAGLAAGEGGGQ